ncbi:MAG: hemerythrin domain-containing protein [Planctomycetes bacterium]|nr:hemerythrin domain-containing protein [Planctomycetota bacterium]
MDAGAFDWAATDHPIDVLLGEHRTILRVLDEVDRECRNLEGNQPLREAFWQDVLRFCDEFDAGLHHQKEEDLLFPLLETNGLSAAAGPTAVLRDEHLRSKFWRSRMGQALAQRDRSRLLAAAASHVDLARSHILKENQILFPLARRLLAPGELEQLHRDFRLLSADQRLSYWLRPQAAVRSIAAMPGSSGAALA